MNNTVAIICSKMQNLKQILNESLKKMLTESFVMFFSPSRSDFSAILRDEYLTSAVGTKEGDKAGSNQPPASEPVQFKLELTPNCLISYLENTGSRSTRYVSMPHPNESSILPNFLEKTDPEVARPAFSTWPVQKSQPKAFEVCASIQIHQSAYRDRLQFKTAGLWFGTANGRDTLNSVQFSWSTIWWLDTLKRIDPRVLLIKRLKLDPGLALTGVRTTGPRSMWHSLTQCEQERFHT